MQKSLKCIVCREIHTNNNFFLSENFYMLRMAVLMALCALGCPHSQTIITHNLDAPAGASALELLYRGEVAPPHLSSGCRSGKGGWEGAIAAIESQAAELEARADEVRGAICQETGVGLKLRQEAGVFRVAELEPVGPGALSGCIQSDDELFAIDQTPVLVCIYVYIYTYVNMYI